MSPPAAVTPSWPDPAPPAHPWLDTHPAYADLVDRAELYDGRAQVTVVEYHGPLYEPAGWDPKAAEKVAWTQRTLTVRRAAVADTNGGRWVWPVATDELGRHAVGRATYVPDPDYPVGRATALDVDPDGYNPRRRSPAWYQLVGEALLTARPAVTLELTEGEIDRACTAYARCAAAAAKLAFVKLRDWLGGRP